MRHESITAIYDVGLQMGYPFTCIEYVAGVPLTERVRNHPLTPAETIELFSPIAQGLAALWRHDVVHRGVSPYGVLIDNAGVPKLTDMVILPRVSLEKFLIDAHKPYMAGFWPPEELNHSADIDSRSDIFSFGASMYFALTGQSPYGIGKTDELIERTLTQPPRDLRELGSVYYSGDHARICDALPAMRSERALRLRDEFP